MAFCHCNFDERFFSSVGGEFIECLPNKCLDVSRNFFDSDSNFDPIKLVLPYSLIATDRKVPISLSTVAITTTIVFLMSYSSELMLMCIERTFASKDDRDALRECMRILQNFSNYLPTKPVTVPPSATGYKHQHYTKGGNTV